MTEEFAELIRRTMDDLAGEAEPVNLTQVALRQAQRRRVAVRAGGVAGITVTALAIAPLTFAGNLTGSGYHPAPGPGCASSGHPIATRSVWIQDSNSPFVWYNGVGPTPGDTWNGPPPSGYGTPPGWPSMFEGSLGQSSFAPSPGDSSLPASHGASFTPYPSGGGSPSTFLPSPDGNGLTPSVPYTGEPSSSGPPNTFTPTPDHTGSGAPSVAPSGRKHPSPGPTRSGCQPPRSTVPRTGFTTSFPPITGG
jgi:hypothetical protein